MGWQTCRPLRHVAKAESFGNRLRIDQADFGFDVVPENPSQAGFEVSYRPDDLGGGWMTVSVEKINTDVVVFGGGIGSSSPVQFSDSDLSSFAAGDAVRIAVEIVKMQPTDQPENGQGRFLYFHEFAPIERTLGQ